MHALGLWRRLVQSEQNALAVGVETCHGPTQRQRLVPFGAETSATTAAHRIDTGARLILTTSTMAADCGRDGQGALM
jgi:hypothetical protein